MPSAARSIAIFAAVLLVVTGCRTITGRSAGQWIDDKTTTAKVKTAIAGAQIGALTRIDVDTNSGTVIVTGVAANDAERQRIVDAAHAAADGKPVTNNIVLVTGKRHEPAAAAAMSPAASPQTQATPAQPHLASTAPPPQTPLKFSRMEAEAPAYGRFAAYDQAGQRVATVYTLPGSELKSGLPMLNAGERRIDHVSIYPHPGSGESTYHVVLWHVSKQQARTFEARPRDAEQVQAQIGQTRAELKAQAGHIGESQRAVEAQVREVEQTRSLVDQAQAQAEAKAREAEQARVKAATAQAEVAALSKEVMELKGKQSDHGVVVTMGGVFFDIGKADIAPGSQRNVDKLAEFLQKYPSRNVVIEGHTDNTGSEDTNLALSQKRADAVKNLLVAKGVSADRIGARGYGPQYPVVSNDTPSGRQQNRRVEVVVLNEGVSPEKAGR